MLDKLKDFIDTLKERIRSPFIGSFIISWCVIHWKVIVLLLYNEDTLKIQQRIDSISTYLSDQDFYTLIIKPVWVTLLVIASYNILNAIGLFLKLLYDNWASPYIQKLLYNSNIIEKSKYEKLNREYNILKAKYDKESVDFIENVNELRDLSMNFDNFRNAAFEAEQQNSVNAVFQNSMTWENTFTFKNGDTGRENFIVEHDGFKLNDGRKIEIANIKATKDGKILVFDKIIEGKAIQNVLVRDRFANYIGFENGDTVIRYRKNLKNIVINSAIYKGGENSVDVTMIIRELVSNGKLEFTVTNELMGGDPSIDIPKSLTVDYTLQGQPKHISVAEGLKVKMDI